MNHFISNIKDIIYYPGHERETLVTWQADAIEAVSQICSLHQEHHNVLIVSHRPIIGGLVALASGIQADEAALDKVVSDSKLAALGYVSLDVSLEGGALDIVLNPTTWL